MADETKLPLTSHDVNAERLAQLRELFPEAFTEGRLDIVRLNQLLGDNIADGPERYGLSWSGKSEAIKNIQTLTSGTLLPGRDESVNFDTTENLIIEGDNLEVLKLLQGGWHGRVKMIYIDPPYNTGGDFIYPDNYKEGLARDSMKSLGHQGGPLSPGEVTDFLAQPWANDAVTLRRADDGGKAGGMGVEGLEQWVPILRQMSDQA